MIISALVRFVLRIYPSEARIASDQEIVSTLLDAGDVSSVALVLQLGSLLRGGFVSRVRFAARQPIRRLMMEGVGSGAMLLLAWTLALLVYRWPPRWGHGIWPADLIVAPVLWALGVRRIAGLVAFLALGTHSLAIGWDLGDGSTIGWTNPYAIAVMLAGSLSLLAAPKRRRPTITRRLSGLALLALSSLLYVAAMDTGPMLLPWVLCGALALAALPVVPGLALGLGAFCFAQALQHSFPIAEYAFPLMFWSPRVLLQWCLLPVALLLIGGTRHRVRASA